MLKMSYFSKCCGMSHKPPFLNTEPATPWCELPSEAVKMAQFKKPYNFFPFGSVTPMSLKPGDLRSPAVVFTSPRRRASAQQKRQDDGSDREKNSRHDYIGLNGEAACRRE